MGCGASSQANSEAVDQAKIDQCILDLKVSRDRLKKYQQQQERTSEIELEKAKELLKKKATERAKLVLRQRKMRATYIMNAQKMIDNVEQQINNVETKQIEMSVRNNLKETNSILKAMNDLMPVEEVEALMDENEEQADRLNEISDLLAQNMPTADAQYCDEEYEKMLNELEDEGEKKEEPKQQQQEPEPEQEENSYVSEQAEPEKVAMLA